MKPLVRRVRADQDVGEAIDYYLQDSTETALSFIDELERAYAHIQRHPAAGSPRDGYELDLPGLRFRPLKRFPYPVFYVEGPELIEVWRVLHARRDIPEWLRQEG